ncbi:MAG: type II toxin-antitoxin system VapC family toxin [Archaeoglobaceae archaeon]
MEVFFDSNVFLHHLANTREVASKLLEDVENGKITGFINDVVVSEVIYGYLRALTNLKPHQLQSKLCKIDFDLSPIKELLSLFRVLSCSFGVEVAEIVEKYKLLPNDALIAATCKHYGIKKIATFDEDFKRVDFLEVLEF